ncbi:hypothetical protein FACS189472_06400 [Alphaproteobacteria bacterium]|nr:hypothetical protein FACS189472_06400 [Alphaproteobacteria bacterium]
MLKKSNKFNFLFFGKNSYKPKTELVDKLISYRLVNFYNGKLLELDLYVSDGKLYKKLKCGKFRPLKKQENFCGYKHYLLRDIDHKRTAVGNRKLDRLAYRSREAKIESIENGGTNVSLEKVLS